MFYEIYIAKYQSADGLSHQLVYVAVDLPEEDVCHLAAGPGHLPPDGVRCPLNLGLRLHHFYLVGLLVQHLVQVLELLLEFRELLEGGETDVEGCNLAVWIKCEVL